MTVLQVQDENSDWHILDTFENEPISLTYTFQELQEVNRPQGSHSNTVRIPATSRNNAYFAHAFDTRSTTYDVKAKRAANILQDGAVILSGHIQLKRVYIVKEEYAEYELVIFGELIDMGREIGDKLLSELDWSSYVHEINATTIEDSWSDVLFSGEIVYGFIDRGFEGWGVGGNPSATGSAIEWDKMTPFVRVSTILDRIFASTKYSYESSFFAAQTNLYTPLFRGGERLALSDEPSTQDLHVGNTSDLTGSGSNLLLQMLDTGTSVLTYSANYYDPNGLWDNATSQYQPAALGTAVFLLYFKITKTAGSGDTKFKIDTLADNSPSLPGFGDGFYNLVPVQTLTTIGDTTEGNNFNGQIYNIAPNMNYSFYVRVTEGDISDLTIETAALYVFAPDGADYTNAVNITVPPNIPEYKAIDYLKDLQTLFNLVMVPDTVDSNKILIEPAQDFLHSGNIVDWTEKIDYNKDVTVEPTTDLQSRTYEWAYAESDDILNEAFISSARRTYGRYKIFDSENDFATDESVRQVGMAPFITNLTAGFLAHRGFDSSGEAIQDALPMIAYFNGAIAANWYLQKPSGSTLVEMSKFPVFSEFSDIVADLNTTSLLFGPDAAHDTGIIPYKNLYSEFWYDYFTNLYSTESRLVVAHAYLTYADIATFSFADTIYLKDGPYRLLKIDGYVANSEETCRVTLLKIVTDAPRCQFTPNASSLSGQILFTDGTNTGLTGNKECCELYGYSWTGSVCRGRTGRPEINNGNGAGGTTPVSPGRVITESTYVQEVSPIKNVLDGANDQTMLVGESGGGYSWVDIGEAIAAFIVSSGSLPGNEVTGSSGLLGDLNSDGQVGTSDLLLLLSSYGETGTTGFRINASGTNSTATVVVTNSTTRLPLFGLSSVTVASGYGIAVDTVLDQIEITKEYFASANFYTNIFMTLVFETDLSQFQLKVTAKIDRHNSSGTYLMTLQQQMILDTIETTGTSTIELSATFDPHLLPNDDDITNYLYFEIVYITPQGTHSAYINSLTLIDG